MADNEQGNTNEQVNRKLHEAMLTPMAQKCLESFSGVTYPDYMHDPEAARGIEAFVIQRVGEYAYGEALCDVIEVENLHDNPNLSYADAVRIVCVSTEQRALACLKALGVEP